MSEDLKPCPFCGGKVEMRFRSGIYGYTSSSVNIRCEVCDIFFSEPTEAWTQQRGHFSIRDQAVVKLLGRWNMRKAVGDERDE